MAPVPVPADARKPHIVTQVTCADGAQALVMMDRYFTVAAVCQKGTATGWREFDCLARGWTCAQLTACDQRESEVFACCAHLEQGNSSVSRSGPGDVTVARAKRTAQFFPATLSLESAARPDLHWSAATTVGKYDKTFGCRQCNVPPWRRGFVLESG